MVDSVEGANCGVKKPHLTAEGEWRFDVEPNALRRNRDWDYRRPGSYEITLTLADRTRDWLGRLVRAAEQARPYERGAAEQARPYERPRKWAIALTPLGEIVLRLWCELAAIWPGIEPHEAQVMPEHFHGILRVTTPQKHPLGQIIGSFKAKATAAARALAKAGEQARPYERAADAAELARPLIPPGVLAGGGLFSPGLHDRILWNLSRYRNAREYLLSNPDRLAAKRANPELFKYSRDLAVALPGAGRAGHFSALGNHYLLERPLWQVQVSRRDFAYKRVVGPSGRLEIARALPPCARASSGVPAGEPLVALDTSAYRARRDAAFAAAANGDVVISPCVSDGERQIAREILAAGFPLVALRNKGFSKHQKPSGRAFDACAAGRLLLLAPAAWPYQPGEKPMTRFDATAMNRLCQWLVGEGAAEIDYHGMRPENIDELARAAVLDPKLCRSISNHQPSTR